MSSSAGRWIAVVAAALGTLGCPLAVEDDYVVQEPEDAGHAGSASATANGGSAGAGGGPTIACGVADTPPGGACPPECTGGCSAGTCRIVCDQPQQCKEAVLACPPGFACALECTSEQTCEKLTLTCSDYACAILCNGTQACKEAILTCGDGPCTLLCGPDRSCENTEYFCGPNSCAVSCAGSVPKLKACDGSCACTPC